MYQNIDHEYKAIVNFISVRTKDGKDYEPSSLRSLLAKNSYSANITNAVFEKTRKVLLSKQKELKKKGKGNRPNASIALTSDEALVKQHYAFWAQNKNRFRLPRYQGNAA